MDIKNWSTLKVFAIALIVPLLVVGGFLVYGELTNNIAIPTEGSIQTSASLLLAEPPAIDWGTITVYGSTTKTVTFTNNSTTSERVTDMTFKTENWLNTTDLGLTLTWNYTGTDIYATQDITVTFTLTSETMPEDITATDFSFTIIVTPTVAS
jgi:hypothetical protein